jgi:hypothetical protein
MPLASLIAYPLAVYLLFIGYIQLSCEWFAALVESVGSGITVALVEIRVAYPLLPPDYPSSGYLLAVSLIIFCVAYAGFFAYWLGCQCRDLSQAKEPRPQKRTSKPSLASQEPIVTSEHQTISIVDSQ